MKWFVILSKMKVEIGGISTRKRLFWRNSQEQILIRRLSLITSQFQVMIVILSCKRDKRKNFNLTQSAKSANIVTKSLRSI